MHICVTRHAVKVLARVSACETAVVTGDANVIVLVVVVFAIAVT